MLNVNTIWAKFKIFNQKVFENLWKKLHAALHSLLKKIKNRPSRFQKQEFNIQHEIYSNGDITSLCPSLKGQICLVLSREEHNFVAWQQWRKPLECWESCKDNACVTWSVSDGDWNERCWRHQPEIRALWAVKHVKIPWRYQRDCIKPVNKVSELFLILSSNIGPVFFNILHTCSLCTQE